MFTNRWLLLWTTAAYSADIPNKEEKVWLGSEDVVNEDAGNNGRTCLWTDPFIGASFLIDGQFVTSLGREKHRHR